jgi:hypothetical protein
VGHHDYCCTQTFPQFENELVEPAGADGVESGRRLVEEQDSGVQRHCPGETGAFLHAATDLGRVELLETGQPDQRELQRHDLGDLGRAELRVLAERQRDVFRERQGTP